MITKPFNWKLTAEWQALIHSVEEVCGLDFPWRRVERLKHKYLTGMSVTTDDFKTPYWSYWGFLAWGKMHKAITQEQYVIAWVDGGLPKRNWKPTDNAIRMWERVQDRMTEILEAQHENDGQDQENNPGVPVRTFRRGSVAGNRP